MKQGKFTFGRKFAGLDGGGLPHGVAYTFIATISEGLRMDDIIRNTRSEVQRLKYDKDGCLMLLITGVNVALSGEDGGGHQIEDYAAPHTAQAQGRPYQPHKAGVQIQCQGAVPLV